MELKYLKKLADKDSVKLELRPDSGIVKIEFTMNKIVWECQFSASINGLYAFTIPGREDAAYMLELIREAIDARTAQKEPTDAVTD